VTSVVLLWHAAEPIGIIVFAPPVASVAARSRYFGLGPRPRGDTLAVLTRQVWTLARVVLHPTYRGAGIASAFVRRACELCPVPWVEALAVMGRVNPVFEKAGFHRVPGTTRSGAAYFIRRGRVEQPA
jgi:GNAT superfamily N-acetyltransferase